MADTPPQEAKPAPRGGPSKLVLIIAVVVAAGAAGGGAWTFAQKDAEKKLKAQAVLLAKAGKAAPASAGEGGESAAGEGREKDKDKDEEEEEGEEEGGGGGEKGPEIKVINMPPFLVNIGADMADMHYLKMSLGIEVAGEEGAKKFEEKTAKVRNNVLMYLSSLKSEDIEGSENRERILKRVRQEVRHAAGSKTARGVYLTEFVVQ